MLLAPIVQLDDAVFYFAQDRDSIVRVILE